MSEEEKSGLGLRGYPLRLDVEGGYVFERLSCGCWWERRPEGTPNAFGGGLFGAYWAPEPGERIKEEWWFCEEHR